MSPTGIPEYEQITELQMNCGTCKYWKPPSERTGYGNAVTLEWKAVEDFDEREELLTEADRQFGFCRKIDMGQDVDPKNLPMATVRDASDYSATLYTQAEFGCRLWEAAEGTTWDEVIKQRNLETMRQVNELINNSILGLPRPSEVMTAEELRKRMGLGETKDDSP